MSRKNKAAQRAIKKRITRDLNIQILDAIAGPRLEELMRMDRHQKIPVYFPVEMPYESFGEFQRLQNPEYFPPFMPEHFFFRSDISHYVRAQLFTLLEKLEKLDDVEYWGTRAVIENSIFDNYDTLKLIIKKRWPQEHASILERKGRILTRFGVFWSTLIGKLSAKFENYSHSLGHALRARRLKHRK